MNFQIPNLADPREMEKLIKQREAEAQKDLDDMLKNDPDFQGMNNASDDELNKLDNSDVNSDDELEKQINAPDEEVVKETKAKKEEEDYFEESSEKMFHRVEAYFSMGILMEELELMDKIVAIKKGKKSDFDIWDMKKGSIELKMNTIKNNVEMGILEIDEYKKDCEKQKNYETKLIEKLTKENKIKFLDQVVSRIKHRIEVLDQEINQNIPPPEEEEHKEEVKVEEPAKKNEEEIDFYEEKTERIIHNTDKYFSMGVLEEELKLMDKIISIKKKKNNDFDCWELKKDKITLKINTITNNVNLGILDLEEYKSDVKKQLDYEVAMKDKLSKESVVNFKDQNIDRIKQRIKILEKELTQNIEEAHEEETHPTEEKKTNISESNSKTKIDEKVMIDCDSKSVNQSISTGVSVKVKKPSGPECVKDKKLYENIKLRLEEYKEASLYFTQIMGNSSSAQDAISKACLLSHALKEMEEGEEIDELTIPLPITTDYICGCSQQERLNRFNTVIKEFSAKKNETSKEMNHYSDNAKLLEKKEFIKRKDEIKSKLDEFKSKIDKFTNLIKKLVDLAKNNWVPAPLFSMVEEEEKKEKINDDIPEHTIKIYFGKTDYEKTNTFLHVQLNVSETNKISEYIYLKEKMLYDHEITIKVEKNDFKRMGKKIIEIDLFRNRWPWPIKATLKGSLKIKLSPLETSIEHHNDFEIILISKRIVPHLNVKMKVRTPFVQKQIETISKTQFNVTKLYTPFKGEGSKKLENDDQKNSKEINNAKVDKKQVVVNPPQKQEKKPVTNTGTKDEVKKEANSAPKKEITYDVSDFSAEELKNPDHIDSLNSIDVLNYKLKKLDEEIKKTEGRIPRALRDPLNRMTVKKQILENQMGAGAVSPNDYLVIMKNQLEKDQKLLKYFQDKGDNSNAKLVAERIPLLMKEISKLIDFLKGKK